MSNWDPTNGHLAAEGYDSDGVGALEEVKKVVSTSEALDALKSTTCICGKNEPSMKSHCRPCYFRLPRAVQRALYNRIGSGYEEAFTKSKALLLKEEVSNAGV